MKTFLSEGEPLVIGLDQTLERRRGKKIAAKGIYRDPVRSSHGHFVKASGLRWVCLMLLVPVPWASRVWALPFLSVLAPSERYAQEQGKPHKKPTDWARQTLLLVRRWWPEREIVAVADSGYTCIRLLAACRRFLPKPVTFVTRLRLDAALYEPARAAQTETDGQVTPQRQALAHLGRGGGRSEHHLDASGGRRLVRQRGAHRRGDLGHGGLVPHRVAAGAPALGPGSRSAKRLCAASPTVHGPRRGTRANLELVRLALADGGDFPRSASAKRVGTWGSRRSDSGPS